MVSEELFMNSMADQIVITEKISQAKNIRDAVGRRYGTILRAEGHLFDLSSPKPLIPPESGRAPPCCGPTGCIHQDRWRRQQGIQA